MIDPFLFFRTSRSPRARCFCAGASGSARRGFSLIELVLVIAIGGIIMAIGVPMVRRNLDSRAVDASVNRLAAFLSDARLLAKQKAKTVVLAPVGADTFENCPKMRSQVFEMTAFTHRYVPEGGVTIKAGPPLKRLVITQSGDFDITQSGYLAVQGAFPDHVAYVTFNGPGAVTVTRTQPATQMSATAIGSETQSVLQKNSGLVADFDDPGGSAAVAQPAPPLQDPPTQQ